MNEQNAHLDLEQLNDLVDGELSGAAEAEAHEHLEGCAPCRRALEELTLAVATLGELDRSARPSRDLWAGIEARIGGATETPDEEPAVVPLHPGGPPVEVAASRTVRVPVSLAWAAGIALALLSGTTAWLAVRGGPEAAIQGGGVVAPVGAFGFVGETPLERPLTPSVENLELILAQARERLAPETVDVLEESLAEVAEAIREAEAALAADPGNAVLNRILGNHQRVQYRLIGHATTLLAQS